MTDDHKTDPAARCLADLVENAMADAAIVMFTRQTADHSTEAFSATWGNELAIREMVRLEYTRNMADEFARRVADRRKDME